MKKRLARTRRAFRLLGVSLGIGLSLVIASQSRAAVGPPEKPQLKFGFIKLTDMAPLAIAYEKGYFEDEGLYVTLEAQANWKVLLNRVIDGELDGAHMLAGQPLGATIGIGTKAHIITSFSMDLNGNGITVSNGVWKKMKHYVPMKDGRTEHPIKASYLKPVVLAAGGLEPGFYDPAHGDTSGTIKANVLLSVTPPPQMPATLEAGTIDGYCVGEPWNEQAIVKGVGVPVVTDYEIWKNNPEKVFGVSAAWAKKYPNTYIHVLKALIRAAKWLDENNNANRPEAVKILSKP
ncbi:MAG: CmpA/NrtA family ABC transporter substrate-binding protein, partial [Gammaproteobacteria bacterium]